MVQKRKYNEVEASSCEASLSRRCGLGKRTAKGKMVKTTDKVFTPSQQDPFHVLGDHEVYEIIRYLEPRDTETLRRVSTLWKASSEYHCGREVLLKYFPAMASKISATTPREEINLLFRRCLYHQESLKAGLATRAVRFNGALDWDIRGDCVIWVSESDEVVSVRQLGSATFSSPKKSGTRRIDVERFIPQGHDYLHIQAVSKDEFLLTTEATFTAESDFEIPEQKLMLVSLSCGIKWRFDAPAPIMGTAVGTGFVLLVYGSCEGEGSGRLYALHLKKLNLSNGSTEMDVIIPQTDQCDI